jgi:hypothetical protein
MGTEELGLSNLEGVLCHLLNVLNVKHQVTTKVCLTPQELPRILEFDKDMDIVPLPYNTHFLP